MNWDGLALAAKVRGTIGEGVNDAGLSRKDIIRKAEARLKRLQTGYIDLYQMPGYDPITAMKETLCAFDDLVQSGKVRYIGASDLAAWQSMKALDCRKYSHLSKFDCLQAYYTIGRRDLEREMIPLLAAQKAGLMVCSPLAGELLAGKFSKEHL